MCLSQKEAIGDIFKSFYNACTLTKSSFTGLSLDQKKNSLLCWKHFTKIPGDEPLHGVLGSQENGGGGQNNQGAGSKVGKSLGSMELGN